MAINDISLLGKHLKLWEAVLSCNLNPIKTKILLNHLESLLQKIVLLMESSDGDEILYQNIFNFEKTLIQVNQVNLWEIVIGDHLTMVFVFSCI